MIKNLGDRTEMEFGTGDIGFNSGVYIDGYDRIVGAVIFYNQEPRKIGDRGDIAAGTAVDFEDFPVVMRFHKTQSIDVLIDALVEAKDTMSNYKEGL